MRIGVPKETAAGERRVALAPETVGRLGGITVSVERGAGETAGFADEAYTEAGAQLADDAWTDVEAVVKVAKPSDAEAERLASGQLLVGFLQPLTETAFVERLAERGVLGFAMESIPRTTRAQAMDALSSQATVAGYKGALLAAERLPKFFPMLTTAAGTIAPAKVLDLGAGVAGLQAIATARRLGAVVSATDVRPATKEQVESLGATFVAVMDDEFKQAQTATGYAKEMSKEYQAKQAELIAETIKKQDIVITTALIPGRKAPVLVTEEMVKTMKPGSVIVDLAAEQGGNCPLTRPNEVVEVHRVTLMGFTNLPGRLAVDSSSLYARNLFNFVSLFVDKKSGALALNWDDEIIKGAGLTRDGAVVHPALKG